MKNFTYAVNDSVQVKVSLVRIMSNTKIVALRCERSEEIFGVNEPISTLHVLVKPYELTDYTLGNLVIEAYEHQSKEYAKIMLDGTFDMLDGTFEEANEKYTYIAELQDLIRNLRGNPYMTKRTMEITK